MKNLITHILRWLLIPKPVINGTFLQWNKGVERWTKVKEPFSQDV